MASAPAASKLCSSSSSTNNNRSLLVKRTASQAPLLLLHVLDQLLLPAHLLPLHSSAQLPIQLCWHPNAGKS
jgi:hypothetical protein